MHVDFFLESILNKTKRSETSQADFDITIRSYINKYQIKFINSSMSECYLYFYIRKHYTKQRVQKHHMLTFQELLKYQIKFIICWYIYIYILKTDTQRNQAAEVELQIKKINKVSQRGI